MANEAVFKYGSTVVLANADGGAITNNQLSAAANVTYSQTNTSDYPDAIFVWQTTGFGGFPLGGSTVDLYIRPMNVDGTTNQPAPNATSTYKGVYVGSFVVTSSQASGDAYRCIGYDIPRSGQAYLFNNATGVTANANWTLKMTPRTIGPA